MSEYALNNRGDVIGRLEEGHNYTGLIFDTGQDLGNGDIVECGGFRCYKYTIKNDLPVENIIKRYGIKDQYNDIVSDSHYHEMPIDGHEIDLEWEIKDSKYNVPKYYVDGSLVKPKPDIFDRPELAKIKKDVNDREKEKAIMILYRLEKQDLIMQDFIDWIYEGKPDASGGGDDERKIEYLEMRVEIKDIIADE